MNAIKSGLRDLKNKIKEMPAEKIRIEKPDKIVYLVEEILKFNEKHQNQQGQGLKTLTPQQMLSRLPIFLAQLKAENNSKELKNETRLYLLYRSKKLSKTVYNHLINTTI